MWLHVLSRTEIKGSNHSQYLTKIITYTCIEQKTKYLIGPFLFETPVKVIFSIFEVTFNIVPRIGVGGVGGAIIDRS